jgi:Na+/phosphate symporter
MRDELKYHEYANWKIENHDLLKYLTENNSDLLIRFKHVLDVTDYLYDKLIDDPNFSDDEDQIFETGFYYLFDQIETITELLKPYQNDYKALELRAKDINLLLAAIDFQNELASVDDYDESDMADLIDFEEELTKRLENKEEVSEDMYEKLDHMTYEIFNKMNVEYFPVNDIFLEIADELGIL